MQQNDKDIKFPLIIVYIYMRMLITRMKAKRVPLQGNLDNRQFITLRIYLPVEEYKLRDLKQASLRFHNYLIRNKYEEKLQLCF